jgi:hypothetical protein
MRYPKSGKDGWITEPREFATPPAQGNQPAAAVRREPEAEAFSENFGVFDVELTGEQPTAIDAVVPPTSHRDHQRIH